ncbi:MAG: domain S-box-containing protein/diguanylate cyclase protein, partial [Aeromicrobium sp.]|nr:domain S-box-containing protein/diguanylate cyclase protein [Aeromicrobium sp.]
MLAACGEADTEPPEAAVASAAMRLITTIDALPDALIALDSRGVVTWATSATSDVLGWHPDELTGRPITVLALEENVEQQQQFLEEMRRTGRAVTYSAQRRRGDGEIVEVSVAMGPVLDPSTGAFMGACASVRSLVHQIRLQTQLAQQDSLSVALSRRSSDVAMIAKADTEIMFASPSIRDVLGFTPEELVGSKGLGLVHEDDLAGVQAFVDRVVSSPGAVERKTFRVSNAHDEWRWIEETLTNCTDVVGVEGLVANLRDVTNEVEARAALTASERRYRTIVETAQEGVLVLDRDARVLVANLKAAQILGHSQKKLHRRQLSDFVGHVTTEDMRQQIASRRHKGNHRFEVTYRHPDGGSRVFEVAASPISLNVDGATGTLAMISDVTDARRIQDDLQHRALHDSLTGLPNRALLHDRLSMALSRQNQEADHPEVAVLCVGLDGFKLINDVHGHEVGDAILLEVAKRLRDVSRPGDTVARLGGDEFVVVAEDIEIDAVLELAARLRTSLLEPLAGTSTPVYMDASVGVAVGLQQSPAALLRSADDALRQAKTQGRGRVHVYDASVTTDTTRKLQVANALRKALDSDQLTLGYQPIVDLVGGHVVAVEALLRWEHPELGPVPPPEIVSTARAIGLAERLDVCVLQRACADMAGLRSRGVGPDIALAVNLSAQSVEGGGLSRVVGDVGRLTGWPLGQLTLELTEGVLMSDIKATATVLARLRELDVSIAIDDFGTGYSSLAYLQRLPVATLKVDRSFVEHVPADPGSCAIARSMIDLARALSLTTVAEGIETQAQADYMRQLGCTRGQGYLWSPAVSPAKLEE